MWAGSDTVKAFGFGMTEEQTRGPGATIIEVGPDDCVPMPNSDAERCTVTVTAAYGTYYFQWFFERVGGDDIIAEPDPPAMFIVAGATTTVTPPPPPPADEQPPLELRDPEDDSICAGNYIGFADNMGDTNVPFRWHEEGGLTGTSLDGDFQILVEPVGSGGCNEAQSNNLVTIDDPNADFYDPAQCVVIPTNINETAILLLPLKDYRWRVRRILDENSAVFGPFTQPSEFTTAGYVTETPTFIDPNGNDATNYPTQGEQLTLGTAISADVIVRWTPVGCNPNSYTIKLFRDGELNPSFFIPSGACFDDVQTGNRICKAEIHVFSGSSYRLELNQQTDFGDINAVLNFSVAELP